MLTLEPSYYMKAIIRRIVLVFLISGSLGMLFYAYIHFSEKNIFPTTSSNFKGFLISALVGSITGVGLYYTNKVLDKLIPWKNFYATRFIGGYIVNYIVAFSMTFGLGVVSVNLLGGDIFWAGFAKADEDMKLKVGILLLATLFIYKVIYALLYSYQQYAVAQLESLQRERKQLELQFEALKSQLSPHYLFNSLNTISSLIYKDRASAEQFVRRLAQTYQYILSTQNKRFVSLKDEVDFVQSYYYLLRIRFQQQLSVEINLPSNIMSSKIPPLTLQILVENAVKHNNISSDKKLFIYITAQDNTYLKVINTKIGNDHTVQSFKVGLENIKKRYEFFTDKKIEIKDDEKFSVTLPVIHHREQEHKHSA
jgi:two-component system, LytTR family, sensor kinase